MKNITAIALYKGPRDFQNFNGDFIPSLKKKQNRKQSGGRLNINMSSYQYRDPHVKDKTVSRPSYL